MMAHWAEHGDLERLRMERFQPIIGTGDAAVGEGGTVRFRVTDVDAECGPGVSILVGRRGGRRQAHLRLPDGHLPHLRRAPQPGRLRDLRTGEVHGEQGEMIRICVNAPEGHVEVDL